jgi:hypothetical protein
MRSETKSSDIRQLSSNVSWEKPDEVANKSNKCLMAKLDDQTIGKAGIPPKNAGTSVIFVEMLLVWRFLWICRDYAI